MNVRRQFLWVGLLVSIGVGTLWQIYPLPDARNRLRSISSQGIGYRSRPVVLIPEERQILARANVLRRQYDFHGQQFELTVIDGTRDRHAVHDPLYCIRGSGWEVVSANEFPVRRGSATLLRLRKGLAETEALIWFSDGHSRHRMPVWYWWRTTLRRLTFGWSGPEPILVRLQTIGSSIVNWREIMEVFPPVSEL